MLRRWVGGGLFLVNVHVNLRHMHIRRYVTGLRGVGVLTFMLTCVTCTSDVTSMVGGINERFGFPLAGIITVGCIYKRDVKDMLVYIIYIYIII